MSTARSVREATPRTRATDEGVATLAAVRRMRDEFVDFLSSLSALESPTDRPESQAAVQAVLTDALRDLGYDTRVLRGRETGGHLYARPARRVRGRPLQLMIGHTDTVWPSGTLAEMPLRIDEGKLYGPGTFDMKGGLTQIVFALRALAELGLEPEVVPIVFINSDEEIGSPESVRYVRALARRACRAFILEPALGPEGSIKTARKGVGRFDIAITGRASHAGLQPEAGVSAIVELSHVIQRLQELNDPAHGITVNVGVIDGGIRPNVVAPTARASVDVRIRTLEDAAHVEAAMRGLEPTTPGTRLSVTGGIRIPPLERTPRNRRLWEQARTAGRELGFDLTEGTAGGGSDGNTTSRFTATIDGLGCLGDGAHAVHEHIEIDASLDRCALLARLLLLPPAE